jgi:hypothetical protein
MRLVDVHFNHEDADLAAREVAYEIKAVAK